jgi:dTDP-4-amino-4,6-dideoxygalactose transaminase
MIVPLYVPWITKKDFESVNQSLNQNQLTDGPILKKFEDKFARLVNSKFAIGVSNATSALHLSLLSLGIGKGDEVIVPNLTFIATANAVLQCNAKPIFADVNENLNISPKSIRSNINKKTKAIIPVHFAGIATDMKSIMKIAKEKKLKVVEDCAHSLGAYFGKKHVGLIGDVGCFSFYPTKNITTIEGGMVVTNSSKISKKIKSLRNHGLNKNLSQRYSNSNPWDYDVLVPGYNYRLDEVRASLGISQLKRFKQITRNRINAAKYYNQNLQNIKGIEIVNLDNSKSHVYHLYIIRIKKEFGVSRNQVHKLLQEQGITTTVHYKPLNTFSCFKSKNEIKNKNVNSLKAYQECLTLPLFPTISKKQQDYVIKKIVGIRK